MEYNTEKYLEIKAEIISAAAHPIRLAIIEYLSDGEKCVCDIAANINAQRSNVSRHLSKMTNAGLLSYRKQQQNIYYSLKTPCILNFLGCIDEIARENAKQAAKLLKSI